MVTLDANFLIAAFRENTAATKPIGEWLARGELIEMSAIAWSEMLCGPLTSEEKERAFVIVGRIEPFTADDAALAADLFNATGRRSRSHADCMIAATAIRRRSVLATLDRPDFARFRRFELQLHPV